MNQNQGTVQRMCAAGLHLAFMNEKYLSAGKNSWK